MEDIGIFCKILENRSIGKWIEITADFPVNNGMASGYQKISLLSTICQKNDQWRDMEVTKDINGPLSVLLVRLACKFFTEAFELVGGHLPRSFIFAQQSALVPLHVVRALRTAGQKGAGQSEVVGDLTSTRSSHLDCKCSVLPLPHMRSRF